MPKAARIGDPCMHPSARLISGSPDTIIGSRPASRFSDHSIGCVVPIPTMPHIGGMLTKCSRKVFINFLPAARVNDLLICPNPGMGPGGGPKHFAAKYEVHKDDNAVKLLYVATRNGDWDKDQSRALVDPGSATGDHDYDVPLEGGGAPKPPPKKVTNPVSGSSGNPASKASPDARLNANRQRLLEGYAKDHGKASAEEAWNDWNEVQKAEFVMLTDTLGHRTPMGGGEPGDNALNHVTKVYEVMGKPGQNGGEDANRMFFQTDDALKGAMRRETSLPGWGESIDPGKIHAPFSDRRETNAGKLDIISGSPTFLNPRPQAQLFKADKDAQAFTRGGVKFPADPNMVELDVDFNLPHDSNPLGDYAGKTGNQRYAEHFAKRGDKAPFDPSWKPSPSTVNADALPAGGAAAAGSPAATSSTVGVKTPAAPPPAPPPPPPPGGGGSAAYYDIKSKLLSVSNVADANEKILFRFDVMFGFRVHIPIFLFGNDRVVDGCPTVFIGG